jgi:hypothetical protein
MFSYLLAFSETPELVWEFDGIGGQTIGIKKTDDGYFVFGTLLKDHKYNSNVSIIDKKGNLLWGSTDLDEEMEVFSDLVIKDDKLILLGYTLFENPDRFFLSHYSHNGEFLEEYEVDLKNIYDFVKFGEDSLITVTVQTEAVAYIMDYEGNIGSSFKLADYAIGSTDLIIDGDYLYFKSCVNYPSVYNYVIKFNLKTKEKVWEKKFFDFINGFITLDEEKNIFLASTKFAYEDSIGGIAPLKIGLTKLNNDGKTIWEKHWYGRDTYQTNMENWIHRIYYSEETSQVILGGSIQHLSDNDHTSSSTAYMAGCDSETGEIVWEKKWNFIKHVPAGNMIEAMTGYGEKLVIVGKHYKIIPAMSSATDIKIVVQEYDLIPDRPPMISNSLPDLTVSEDSGPFFVYHPVSDMFSDPDGDEITITIESEKVEVEPFVRNDSLIVSVLENWNGKSKITVTGTANEKSVSDSFVLTVEAVDDPICLSILTQDSLVVSLYDTISFKWSCESLDKDTLEYLVYFKRVSDYEENYEFSFTTHDTLVEDNLLNISNYKLDDERNYELNWNVLVVNKEDTIKTSTKKIFVQGHLVDIEKEDEVFNYELHQNYPNPFNPTTTIRYKLPKETLVVLEVYNMVGQKVQRIEKNSKRGINEIKFNGSDLPNGMYIYKLQADNFTKVRKMVLLK